MSTMSRRTLLRSIATAGAAAAVPGLLSACSSSSAGGDVSNAGKKLAPWPTYSPSPGPTPDLAPTTAGVQAGFTTYPSDLVSSVKDTPGDGTTTLKVMSVTFGTPPKSEGSNQFWKAVEKALGVKIEYTVIPTDDYQAKMATVMAGDSGDLPDIINMFSGFVLPREAQFVEARAQDLTPYLSGDAVKKYPNLAGIPAQAWQDMGRIGGKIYGIPLERPVPGSTLWLNQSVFTDAGMHDGWTSDDFAAVAKKATHGKTFALGSAKGSDFNLNVHAAAHNAPNNWAVDSKGAFHAGYTDERFKEAVSYLAQLRKSGYYHPDATSLSSVDANTLLLNGTIGSLQNGFGAYQTMYPDAKGLITPTPALPYSVNGTPGGVIAARRSFGYTILKKASKERIELLLRVLNYLAAPFGTKEYELTHFGVEGVHFTRDKDGSPVPNERWQVEGITNLPFRYLAEGPQVLFLPGFPDAVRALHAWQQKVVPVVVRDASYGLQSSTNNAQGTTLKAGMDDAITSVIAGRASLSSLDGAISKWRSGGGDRMADEYAKERAANA